MILVTSQSYEIERISFGKFTIHSELKYLGFMKAIYRYGR